MRFQYFDRKKREWGEISFGRLLSLLKEDREFVTPALIKLMMNEVMITRAGCFRIAVKRVQ